MIDLTRVEVTPENEAEVLAAVDSYFTYQPWTSEQIAAGVTVRTDLSVAYMNILRLIKPSALRTRALNAIIDARMLANAAITFEGK